MDTGRARNAADVLGFHGYPSQNALAAAARGLMFIERYGRVFPSQRDSHLYVTPVTTLEYVRAHPELVDPVRLGDPIYHSGIQGGIGLWSIIMASFLRLDPEQAEQFTEHLTTGAGLHRGHPVLMLRNRLLGSQRDHYSTLSGRETLVAIAIKSWNAWREGKSLQTLMWRGEAVGPSLFQSPSETLPHLRRPCAFETPRVPVSARYGPSAARSYGAPAPFALPLGA